MKTYFVDSNVFVRFFGNDDIAQHTKARELLQQAADGKIALLIGPPVLFEVDWTLRSAFRQSREKILDALQAISAMKGLTIIDLDLVEDAINQAASSGREFADAYIAVSARAAGADAVATFNRKHFEKLDVELFPF